MSHSGQSETAAGKVHMFICNINKTRPKSYNIGLFVNGGMFMRCSEDYISLCFQSDQKTLVPSFLEQIWLYHSHSRGLFIHMSSGPTTTESDTFSIRLLNSLMIIIKFVYSSAATKSLLSSQCLDKWQHLFQCTISVETFKSKFFSIFVCRAVGTISNVGGLKHTKWLRSTFFA